MSNNTQTVNTIVAVSVGVIVAVGTVFMWPSVGEHFGRATTNPAVAVRRLRAAVVAVAASGRGGRDTRRKKR
jgi:hypothetical protein